MGHPFTGGFCSSRFIGGTGASVHAGCDGRQAGPRYAAFSRPGVYFDSVYHSSARMKRARREKVCFFGRASGYAPGESDPDAPGFLRFPGQIDRFRLVRSAEICYTDCEPDPLSSEGTDAREEAESMRKRCFTVLLRAHAGLLSLTAAGFGSIEDNRKRKPDGRTPASYSEAR